MAFSQAFLKELESRCRIEEIVSPYVELKRRGKNLVGLCPFHNEKTPSFNVSPENNFFYCFGCNKGGGVLQFIMGVENLAFPDAVRWLAQRVGMQVPEEGVDDSMSRLRTRILEINRESGRFYYKMLSAPEGAPGLEYLKSRGLDARTIKRFGLGYAPDSGYALVNHLRGMGYTVAEMQAADMARLSKNGNPYDRYRSRVMFPILDLRGNVVAFGGRLITAEKASKYINTADTPVYHKSSGLFAMNIAKDSGNRQLILAEGYMDVIALHRAGFTNAVASLGTALTEEQARIMRRYADEVVICYDSDEAGQRATQRAIPILKNAGLLVKVITVPGGKDPDEFMRTYGEDGPIRFKQLLEGSGNDVEYRLAKIKARYDLETEDGKVRYLREAVSSVLSKLDRMERDVYAGKLAQETGVARDSILAAAERQAMQELRKKRRELAHSQQVEAARTVLNREKEKNLKAALAEEGVISYLFRHPDRSEALKQSLPPEKFVTELNRRVYGILLGKTVYGEVSLSDFSQDLTADELSELTRILAERKTAPPTWNDVEEYTRILLTEGGFSDPEKIKNASQEDLKRYLDELKKQK